MREEVEVQRERADSLQSLVERLRGELSESREVADIARRALGSGAVSLLRRAYPHVGRAGSQFAEDEILAKLLPAPSGFYVDVGAGEPVECSNTWQFYRRGWRGVLVEPLPQFWYAIMRQRPGDWLRPVAAYSKAGLATLRIAGTVSSMRPDWDIAAQTELSVETDTLTNILAAHPDVMKDCSLMSLDVEGAEAEVLAGIDWSRFRPRVIIVEFRLYDPAKPGRDVTETFEPLLTRVGYRFHAQTELNKVYTRG